MCINHRCLKLKQTQLIANVAQAQRSSSWQGNQHVTSLPSDIHELRQKGLDGGDQQLTLLFTKW